MCRMPGAGRHPLGVAVGDQAAAAVGVLVLERAVDHVGDGLEAAVRVPRRALRLARRVLHLAHLVHVDERVEVAPGRRRRTRGGPGSPRPRSRSARSSRRRLRGWASGAGGGIRGSVVGSSTVIAGIGIAFLRAGNGTTLVESSIFHQGARSP